MPHCRHVLTPRPGCGLICPMKAIALWSLLLLLLPVASGFSAAPAGDWSASCTAASAQSAPGEILLLAPGQLVLFQTGRGRAVSRLDAGQWAAALGTVLAKNGTGTMLLSWSEAGRRHTAVLRVRRVAATPAGIQVVLSPSSRGLLDLQAAKDLVAVVQ